MKIRLSQLRQIIKEEAKRAINETGDKSIGAFDKMLPVHSAAPLN